MKKNNRKTDIYSDEYKILKIDIDNIFKRIINIENKLNNKSNEINNFNDVYELFKEKYQKSQYLDCITSMMNCNTKHPVSCYMDAITKMIIVRDILKANILDEDFDAYYYNFEYDDNNNIVIQSYDFETPLFFTSQKKAQKALDILGSDLIKQLLK